MDDEDVNVSSDVVLVALADVGGSVDVDSTAIKYNHNVTVTFYSFNTGCQTQPSKIKLSMTLS